MRGTVAQFFEDKFGVDWTAMKVGNPVDVSSKNVRIKAFDHEKGEGVYKRVLTLIRKPDSEAYQLRVEGNNSFRGAASHKVWAKLHLSSEPTYLELKTLLKRDFYTFKEGQWVASSVRRTGETTPVLDFEVEDTHNYFSDDVLSHNTMYGNPETTTGGEALKFYAAIRLTVRKGEQILGKGEDVVGMECKIKSIKNKVSTPFKIATLKIIFGKGYSVDEEYVMAFSKYDIIDRGGTGWYTFKIDGKVAKVQGTPAAIKFLQDNPKFYTELKLKLMSTLKNESKVETVIQEEAIPETEETIASAIEEQTKLEEEALAETDIAKLAALAGADPAVPLDSGIHNSRELIEPSEEELSAMEETT